MNINILYFNDEVKEFDILAENDVYKFLFYLYP